MLSLIFKPTAKYELVRLGSKNDGGYLVEKRSFKETDTLISIGINDDWSFEKSFLGNIQRIITVDDKLNFKFLIKKLILSLLFFRIKNFFPILNKIFEYFFLFKKNKFLHIKKFVCDFNSNNTITLDTLVKDLKINSDKIFLKIDIEGSEYRLLEDLILIKKRLKGLIIEFHHFDLHYERIINFIKKIDLNLAHIHPNNFSPINKYGDPTTIEMTFTAFDGNTLEEINLPNDLDAPNNPNFDDINLNFS